MKTTLVVAEPSDRLAQCVANLIPGVIRCSERELLDSCRFALLQDGTEVDGVLSLSGRSIPFAHLSGVLFRPGRGWRPPPGMDARHRAFVRHEMQAAWCAVLNALPCPVFNRLPPAWWLASSLLRAQLAQSFAQQLDLPLEPGDVGQGSRSGYAPAPLSEKLVSAYIVGKHFFCKDVGLHSLRVHLAEHDSELERWQRSSGIVFARIDVSCRGGNEIAHVEPLPTMGRTPEVLLASVSGHIAGALS
jgi:hypothetical protein